MVKTHWLVWLKLFNLKNAFGETFQKKFYQQKQKFVIEWQRQIKKIPFKIKLITNQTRTHCHYNSLPKKKFQNHMILVLKKSFVYYDCRKAINAEIDIQFRFQQQQRCCFLPPHHHHPSFTTEKSASESETDRF